MGRDTSGPTAALNSISKNMHQDNVWDGTLLNLRFDPSGVSGEKGLKIIESVVKEFGELQSSERSSATERGAREKSAWAGAPSVNPGTPASTNISLYFT